jgi:hypothetical protein
MSYDYQKERQWVFTDEGQRQFLRIRDKAFGLIRQAGAVKLDCLIHEETGSSWEMLACVDRLVELGELKEITQPDTVTQHRVFIVTTKD